MADYTPSATQSLLAHQAVTHPATVAGTARDGNGILGAYLYLYHALVEAAANTNPGSFLVQVTHDASNNEHWITVATFRTFAGTVDTEALTATEPSGETVLAVASTTGFAAAQQLYIQDTGTLADSEWARCQEIVTNTSIDLIDGLTTGKDSADVAWNNAELFGMWLDLAGVRRYRVIYQHEGATGADAHIKADSIEVTAFE